MSDEYDKIYILIYFIYGLAFFSMGISILQNKVEKGSDFLLLKSMKFLGLFGLTHGITEWIIMIIIAYIYNENRRALYILAILFNTLSFVFLLYFGIILMEYNGRFRRTLHYIPISLFAIWIGGVIVSLISQNISEQLLQILNLFSRYLIGLPASILAAVALNRSIKLIKLLKLDKIAIRIRGIAISFLIYGILAGVFVKKTTFFPSNLINSQLFYDVTRIHVEVARTIVAIIITILSVSIVDLFRWVNKQKIMRLTNLELVNDERRRLCQNLHDVIIQNIFATGLRIETILDNETEIEKKKNLSDIKDNLSDTIYQIRDYIGAISVHKIDIEGLKNKIHDLIIKQKELRGMEIEFYHDITDIAYNYLPTEKLAEVYFIAQEALSNAIKHSKAQRIVITLTISLISIHVLIYDNGTGFDIENKNNQAGYGLTSMNERALTLGGVLNLKSNENGTEITLIAPWRNEREQ